MTKTGRDVLRQGPRHRRLRRLWNGAYFAVLQLSAIGQCRRIAGDDWIELFRTVGN